MKHEQLRININIETLLNFFKPIQIIFFCTALNQITIFVMIFNI